MSSPTGSPNSAKHAAIESRELLTPIAARWAGDRPGRRKPRGLQSPPRGRIAGRRKPRRSRLRRRLPASRSSSHARRRERRTIRRPWARRYRKFSPWKSPRGRLRRSFGSRSTGRRKRKFRREGAQGAPPEPDSASRVTAFLGSRMPPRANWKGVIRIGDLTCPVALYTAASTSERIAFHMLNRKTGDRVHRQFVDQGAGKPVESDDQVKGYE